MHRILIAGLALLFLGTGPSAHAKDDLWIHVSVDGGDDDPERVRINLPLALISTVLPLIEHDEFRHGRIRLDNHDLDKEEMVAILRAVAVAKEGEYVTVDDADETVRVSKKGGMILVKVEERDRDGRGKEHVDIRVPVSVLEALVSGDDDELNVLAAIEALSKDANGNLVTVNDEDGTLVKVWIDDRNISEN
jgi:hypothetical protein